MNNEPSAKRRKMEPHSSGDDLTQEAGQGQIPGKVKSLLNGPSGSPSGDFLNAAPHQFVTFVSSEQRPVNGAHALQEVGEYEQCKQACEIGDAWQHKYPVPLSSFPQRPIKTGNFFYDGIITDLECLGYRPLQIIAKGRYGTVILAQDLHKCNIFRECETVPVALKLNSGKTRRKSRVTWKADMLDEMSIHRQLVHPHIVRWINNINYQGRVGTVLEFCENGTLEQLIKIRESRLLTEGVARRYFGQLFSAVEYIHLLGYAHRDICMQNLLITRGNTIKLTDFGHAVRFMIGDPLCEDECGSLGYQAPEMLTPVPYNPKTADIWSLGVLLHSMCTGKLPWGVIKGDIVEKASKEVRFPEDRILPLSPELKLLIRGMLTFATYVRFTLNRIRASPWLQNPPRKNKVQIGNFYLIRQPQKMREGLLETEIKRDLQI